MKHLITADDILPGKTFTIEYGDEFKICDVVGGSVSYMHKGKDFGHGPLKKFDHDLSTMVSQLNHLGVIAISTDYGEK